MPKNESPRGRDQKSGLDPWLLKLPALARARKRKQLYNRIVLTYNLVGQPMQLPTCSHCLVTAPPSTVRREDKVGWVGQTSNSMTSELTILVTKTLFEGQRRALEPRSSLTPDLAAR